jgi:hypothetical protein
MNVPDGPGAVAGGIAALLALAGLGAAAAARSSAFAAACAEASRFPFPRFRVLPCRRVGVSPLEAPLPAAPTGSRVGGRPTATHQSPRPPGGSAPLLPPLPRIGVLGASVAKTPWSVVKGIVVALLAVVNAVLVGIRFRVGRLQAR